MGACPPFPFDPEATSVPRGSAGALLTPTFAGAPKRTTMATTARYEEAQGRTSGRYKDRKRTALAATCSDSLIASHGT